MTQAPPVLLDDVDRELFALAERHGLPKYRCAQMRRWLFDRRAEHWGQMSDLPKSLRDELTEVAPIWTSEIARHTTSADGTEKLLLNLRGGGQIECVLLRGIGRITVCISTQVGCGMGCVFCASGLDGVERNLSSGEILEQVLRLQHRLAPDERLTHVVVMGMGEPLANIDGMLPALNEVSREDGLAISPRRITISTVGLPQAIKRLAEQGFRYRLAISLHAPNDELRNQIVPVNRKIGIQAILQAADEFFARSRRRLTFEYVLLADLNDQPGHARELVKLLANREAILNVIPYNPVSGLPYSTPSLEAQHTFRRILEAGGLRVRFRHRKGDAIDAACGQLRRRSAPEPVVLSALRPGN